MKSVSISTASTGVMWNGPICGTCGARYLGSHQCSQADILRRVNELLALLNQPNVARDTVDTTRNCPCRPENGGSGICGCIFGGPKVTC